MPLLIGALVVIAALIGAFVLLNGDESDTIRLRGSFTLVDSDFEITGSWTSCRGTGGYDDFEAGANVTVRDGDGKIIASGETVNADRSNIDDLALIDQVVGESRNPDNLQLDQNDIDEFRTTFESMADSGYYCVLYFEAEVPVSEFYEVSIGSRGELSYSREELAATGYMISLSLGG